jgi:hypothetical protein
MSVDDMVLIDMSHLTSPGYAAGSCLTIVQRPPLRLSLFRTFFSLQPNSGPFFGLQGLDLHPAAPCFLFSAQSISLFAYAGCQP